jgi:hypothetical protein
VTYLAMSIYYAYLILPLILVIEGNENRFRWKTSMFGSLVSSVFIFALEFYLHFSHLYWSLKSKESSFRKLTMHLSSWYSKAKLSVINGLKVIDLLLHLPQVTMVLSIPKENTWNSNRILTTEESIYYRRVCLVVIIPSSVCTRIIRFCALLLS